MDSGREELSGAWEEGAGEGVERKPGLMGGGAYCGLIRGAAKESVLERVGRAYGCFSWGAS